MTQQPSEAAPTGRTSSIAQRPWFIGVVALVVGLVIGLIVGVAVLAGVFDDDEPELPSSCVQTIERAEEAIANAESIVENSEAALDAVRDIQLGDAATLLREVAADSIEFLDQVEDFNRLRQRCFADREG